MVKKIHKEFMNVIESLINKKLKSEPIQAIILGGSVARGDETEDSDIDIVFYVKKRDMPKNLRRFYKFRGKYIEEHYSEIENLKNENILPDEKILYDRTNKIRQNKFNEKIAKRRFNANFREAKQYYKLAENSLKKKKFEKAFHYLYGLGSPAFIIMHALPPRFNLPFPSFRLLKSLKRIDKKYKTRTYEKVEKIYNFENKNQKQILRDFQKAYILMNKIKKSKNTNSENLGFFDEAKIKYNVEGLKKTFENYPFVFAYRFIVGCLTMWAFNKNTRLKEIFYKILIKVLGVQKINERLIKEKLKLTKELFVECEKLRLQNSFKNINK